MECLDDEIEICLVWEERIEVCLAWSSTRDCESRKEGLHVEMMCPGSFLVAGLM